MHTTFGREGLGWWERGVGEIKPELPLATELLSFVTDREHFVGREGRGGMSKWRITNTILCCSDVQIIMQFRLQAWRSQEQIKGMAGQGRRNWLGGVG